jgi:nucleotide-binding universal stress UspA family protein
VSGDDERVNMQFRPRKYDHLPNSNPPNHKRGSGTQDIVVGVDGSDTALCAMSEALDLLTGRIRACVLVAVADNKSAREARLFDHGPLRETLEHTLAQARADHPEIDFLTLTRAGRADEELCAVAEQGEYQLLVIGASGSGGATALLGSTAPRIIRRSSVPVFVGSQHEVSRTRSVLSSGRTQI